MPKKITKVEPTFGHHIKITLEDGTTEVLRRGDHLARSGSVVANTGAHASDPIVGETWPRETNAAVPQFDAA